MEKQPAPEMHLKSRKVKRDSERGQIVYVRVDHMTHMTSQMSKFATLKTVLIFQIFTLPQQDMLWQSPLLLVLSALLLLVDFQ